MCQPRAQLSGELIRLCVCVRVCVCVCVCVCACVRVRAERGRGVAREDLGAGRARAVQALGRLGARAAMR